MPRTWTEIAAELKAFTPHDFDLMNIDSDGDERLSVICDELIGRDDPERWAPLLYALMERLDDVGLGTPGPIVHTLETWNGYDLLLADSLRRKPTPLTLWMANRRLNIDPPDAAEWLGLLQRAMDHPAASPETRAEARFFLEHHAMREPLDKIEWED